MKNKKILIFTYTDLNRDPIVANQISWLCHLYDLYVVCAISNNTGGVKYIRYPSAGFLTRNLRTLLLKLRCFKLYTWSHAHKKLVQNLSGIGFELIIVHHLKLIPLAIEITPKTKVILYAHEYYMNMYDHSLWWRIFIKNYFLWLAGKYLPVCDYTITVNESIKGFYETNYGIKADYIHSAMKYQELKPLAVNHENIKILYHGLAGTSRKLELMIELMKYLDPKFTLTLILHTNSIVNDYYIKKIKKMASGNPRIKFRELVPLEEVAAMGNQYDIGLFISPAVTLNIKYNLANKIFQYIQSRLMLVVSPLPEMKKIVENYNLGIVGEDYDVKKLAEKMNALTAEEIMYYKNQSDLHAKELGSDSGRMKFLRIVNDIIAGNQINS